MIRTRTCNVHTAELKSQRPVANKLPAYSSGSIFLSFRKSSKWGKEKRAIVPNSLLGTGVRSAKTSEAPLPQQRTDEVFQCFSPVRSPLGTPHLDARALHELGVWLGDHSEPWKEVFRCPRYQMVQKQYFIRTIDATISDEKLGLETNVGHVARSMLVACASCGLSIYNDVFDPLRLEYIRFASLSRSLAVRSVSCAERLVRRMSTT
jgi:hypothetical protein